MKKSVIKSFVEALIQSKVCSLNVARQAYKQKANFKTFEEWKKHYFEISAFPFRLVCLGGMLDTACGFEQKKIAAEITSAFVNEPKTQEFLKKLDPFAVGLLH